MKKTLKKRSGFTLIELVMVVAILGVLSSIALVKYTDVSKDSKLNSDYITANNIATATKLALNDGKIKEGNEITVEELNNEGYLEGEPRPQSVIGGNFTVNINNGIVNVVVGNDLFYPKPSNEVSNNEQE